MIRRGHVADEDLPVAPSVIHLAEWLSVQLSSELDDALNFREVPSFAADALHGTGVFETLRGIAGIVLRRLSAGTSSPPAAAAAGGR